MHARTCEDGAWTNDSRFNLKYYYLVLLIHGYQMLDHEWRLSRLQVVLLLLITW